MPATSRGGSANRELLARAALGFAGVVIGVEVDQHVIAVLEEGLAAAPAAEDSGLRAMLLARLAMELYLRARRRAPRRRSVPRRWRRPARAGDVRALAHALEARHFAVWSRTGPLARLALADEMIQSAGEIDSAELVMRGHHLRISALLELGRIDDVDAAIADLRAARRRAAPADLPMGARHVSAPCAR